MAQDDAKIDKALQLIGNRLEQIRKEKGFSNYEQYAYHHGFTRSKYYGYENGKNMHLSTFLHILYTIDVDPVAFFSEINDEMIKLDE